MLPRYEHERLNPVTLGQAYGGIQVIDYGRPGTGLLIAVGSGLMMAAMDMLPGCRWCTDAGGRRDWDKFAGWLEWMNRYASFVAVAAWFSISKPEGLAGALRVVKVPLFVYSNVDLGVGKRFSDLDALVEYAGYHEIDADELVRPA